MKTNLGHHVENFRAVLRLFLISYDYYTCNEWSCGCLDELDWLLCLHIFELSE
jgi:hypothetical protein